MLPGNQNNRNYREILGVSGSGQLGDIFNVTTDYQLIIPLYNMTTNELSIAEFIKYPLASAFIP